MAQHKNAIFKWTKCPLIVLLTVIAFGLAGCGGDSPNNPAGPDPDPDPDPSDIDTSDMNIVQAIQEHDDLSVLYQAIVDAGLEDSLEGEGPLTLLAPVNSAFDNLPDGFIDNLSQDQIKILINYHIISSEMTSDELGEQETIQTIQESSVFVRMSGEDIEFNRGTLHGGSSVTEANIEASNGVIHKMNEVLLPDIFLDVLAIADKRYNLTKFVCNCTTGETGANLQPVLQDPDAELTVFVPTDEAFDERGISSLPSEEIRRIMEYHIVEEKILSGDLSDGQTLTTRNGAELTVGVAGDGTISLDEGIATVLEADLEGINGIVYIIDAVLSPPDN